MFVKGYQVYWTLAVALIQQSTWAFAWLSLSTWSQYHVNLWLNASLHRVQDWKTAWMLLCLKMEVGYGAAPVWCPFTVTLFVTESPRPTEWLMWRHTAEWRMQPEVLFFYQRNVAIQQLSGQISGHCWADQDRGSKVERNKGHLCKHWLCEIISSQFLLSWTCETTRLTLNCCTLPWSEWDCHCSGSGQSVQPWSLRVLSPGTAEVN